MKNRKGEGLTAPLSRGLQDSSIHLGDAVIRVNAVILALETRRNDEDVFTDIFNEASKTAHLLGIDLNIPRRANCQQHRANAPAMEPKVFFRRTVFLPFTDHLINDLRRRFADPPPIFALQELQPQFQREGSIERVCNVAEKHEWDLPSSVTEAKAEIRAWMETSREENAASLQECILRAKRMMLPNVALLLRLFTVLPVTTATAERTFSGLRRLKTYLRSTMGSERLNGLALLTVHRTMPVDMEDIIDRFRDMKPRRIPL